MTTLTASNVQPDAAASESDSINLYKLGMLFVVKCRYWSCRAGNDPDELELTPDRIDARAIASFGTEDLLDPDAPASASSNSKGRPITPWKSPPGRSPRPTRTSCPGTRSNR